LVKYRIGFVGAGSPMNLSSNSCRGASRALPRKHFRKDDRGARVLTSKTELTRIETS
jgi:hypothetical protein